MRFILIVMTFLPPSYATAAPSTPKVHFQATRMHGFYNFVETLGGNPNRTRAVGEFYEKSPYATAEREKQILELRDLLRGLKKSGWQFSGLPVERTTGTSVASHYVRQSMLAKDLNDFKNRTAGLTPLADQARLFGLLEKLLPVYDELIWRKNSKWLQAYRSALATQAKTWKMDSLLQQAARFYGTDWPKGMPFYVDLYPIPVKSGPSSAESVANFESVGVWRSEHADPSDFGVIFHEICHSLYAAQPRDLQETLEKAFLANPSPSARIAYAHFNEALATALGNGWAAGLAGEDTARSSWYNDRYIEGFARAIYPKVLEYVKAGHTIDAKFVESAIALFQEKFPDARNDVRIVFQSLSLAVDGKGLKTDDAVSALRDSFQVSSLYASAPFDHPETVSEMSSNSHPVLLGLGPDQTDRASELLKKIPGLSPSAISLVKKMKPRQIAWSTETDSRSMIAITAGDAKEWSEALKAIRALKTLTPSASPSNY